ncbi:hypothetical protein Tco_1082600 [Tanacetum coccineum]|uniref:Uncharacterized protein n=1 Tax=Tanacetum coccineum TaxID=301880 RepID=A0ABQ5I161_9ASTR
MAETNVPQLIDKKGGSYSAIALRLKVGKFSNWKKCMVCYLIGMEPYYITCIKDGPFQPKTAKGANKTEAQWSNDESTDKTKITRKLSKRANMDTRTEECARAGSKSQPSVNS